MKRFCNIAHGDKRALRRPFVRLQGARAALSGSSPIQPHHTPFARKMTTSAQGLDIEIDLFQFLVASRGGKGD